MHYFNNFGGTTFLLFKINYIKLFIIYIKFNKIFLNIIYMEKSIYIIKLYIYIIIKLYTLFKVNFSREFYLLTDYVFLYFK